MRNQAAFLQGGSKLRRRLLALAFSMVVDAGLGRLPGAAELMRGFAARAASGERRAATLCAQILPGVQGEQGGRSRQGHGPRTGAYELGRWWWESQAA